MELSSINSGEHDAAAAIRSLASADRCDDLTMLAEHGVSEARAAGADQVAVHVSTTRGQRASAMGGRHESVIADEAASLVVQVFRDGRKASATASTLGRDIVAGVARRAVALLPFGDVDPLQGVPAADALAWDVVDPLGRDPALLSTEETVSRAIEVERAALAVDPCIAIRDAGCSSHVISTALANSHGFARGYVMRHHYVGCTAIAQGASGKQGGDWWNVARSLAQLEAADAVGRSAAERALARLDPRPLASMTVPVLFDAPVAEGLVGHLVSALSGDALYRGTSFLADAFGTAMMPVHVDLLEDPTLPWGMATVPFDAEGVAPRARKVIDAGRVAGQFLSTYSARRLGAAGTGSAGGSSNLALRSRDTVLTDDLPAMLRRLNRGLYVTEAMGQGVSIASGNYSRAVAGFWVEGGEIAYSVEGITIAGNLATMFAGIAAIGSDALHRGAVSTGSILVDAMHVSGSAS